MTTPIQPGWYDDPEDSNAQRYWDGQNWTPHRQRKPVSVRSSPPPSPTAASNVPPPRPFNQQAPWLPPGYQSAGPPRRKSNGPIVAIGAIAASVVLVVCGLLVYHHFGKSSHRSPEDQIRAVVQQEADDYNRSSTPAFNPALECKANASEYDGKDLEELRQLRAQAGNVSVSVANIHVTGDQATADVTARFAGADEPVVTNKKFVKEDGSWKDCSPQD